MVRCKKCRSELIPTDTVHKFNAKSVTLFCNKCNELSERIIKKNDLGLIESDVIKEFSFSRSL